MSNYLILQVISPIFFALINILIGSNRFGQIIFLLSTILNLIFLAPLYNELIFSENDSIIYLLGGFENKYGIELKLNYFNFIFLIIANYTSFIVAIYKINFKDFLFSKNSLLLLAIAGFNGILVSNDIFNIYVFLEISSLASYALIASNNKSLPSLHASFNYLIFGTIGATFYLVGVAILYLFSGTLNISILLKSTGIWNEYTKNFIVLSFFFITCGLLVKIAIFPVHNWLNTVYKKSENYLTAFFAGTSTIVSLYLFCLFVFNIFIWKNVSAQLHYNFILQAIGTISMIYFAFFAYENKNMKKILVYSSFAQMGYFFCCLGIGIKAAIFAFCMQLINHGISKSILFLLFSNEMLICIKDKKAFHFLVSAFFVLNSIGVPVLFGFFAKFNFISAIIEDKNWIVLLGTIISSFFSVLYGLKLTRGLLYKDDYQLKKLYEFEETQNSSAISITKTQLYVISFVSISLALLLLAKYNELSDFLQFAVSNLLIVR